ncbi:hypothetical protein IG631_21853 [Alternaria alternata]|nr:hypothetical protein IG631_21853 [Alternaria alternata]
MSRISSAAVHHIAYRACHIDNGEFPVQTADSVNAVDHDTRAVTPLEEWTASNTTQTPTATCHVR